MKAEYRIKEAMDAFDMLGLNRGKYRRGFRDALDWVLDYPNAKAEKEVGKVDEHE